MYKKTRTKEWVIAFITHEFEGVYTDLSGFQHVATLVWVIYCSHYKKCGSCHYTYNPHFLTIVTDAEKYHESVMVHHASVMK